MGRNKAMCFLFTCFPSLKASLIKQIHQKVQLQCKYLHLNTWHHCLNITLTDSFVLDYIH